MYSHICSTEALGTLMLTLPPVTEGVYFLRFLKLDSKRVCSLRTELIFFGWFQGTPMVNGHTHVVNLVLQWVLTTEILFDDCMIGVLPASGGS